VPGDAVVHRPLNSVSLPAEKLTNIMLRSRQVIFSEGKLILKAGELRRR